MVTQVWLHEKNGLSILRSHALAAKAWPYGCEVAALWVVVKIRVPFWLPIMIRHQIFRVPKKGP